MLKCEHCDKTDDTVTKHKQFSNYKDEEKNFITLCESCKIDNDRYWEWFWSDADNEDVADV